MYRRSVFSRGDPGFHVFFSFFFSPQGVAGVAGVHEW